VPQADYPFVPISLNPVITRCWTCGAIAAVPKPGAAAVDRPAARQVRPQAPRRCKDCRVARYCGPTCQLADWPRHRRECDRQSGPCAGHAERSADSEAAEADGDD
jgi:hypothetical protein